MSEPKKGIALIVSTEDADTYRRGIDRALIMSKALRDAYAAQGVEVSDAADKPLRDLSDKITAALSVRGG